ncbi:MAG: hypothetical protein V4653_20985 [Pseudomonadota bacterium]
MMWVQVILSVICAAPFWLAEADNPNHHVRLWGSLITGFLGMRALMFLYVWARYGLRAARSMTMG